MRSTSAPMVATSDNSLLQVAHELHHIERVHAQIGDDSVRGDGRGIQIEILGQHVPHGREGFHGSAPSSSFDVRDGEGLLAPPPSERQSNVISLNIKVN